MKKIINTLVMVISIVYAVIATVIRFRNPDLSETRLFMQYWWFYTLIPVGFILFYIVANLKFWERRRK